MRERVRLGIREGRVWACDNGAFSAKFDFARMLGYLEHHTPYRNTCEFVVAPDTVGDHRATRHKWDQFAPDLSPLGFPLAFVLQDGFSWSDLPDTRHVFVGGTDHWRSAIAFPTLIREAKGRGLFVHVGRVNTLHLVRTLRAYGADSCDGTKLIFMGKQNFLRMFTNALQEGSFVLDPIPQEAS